MSITCLCGVPNGTLHSHFCPLAGRVVPRLEYAPEGTSQKLRDAEATIQRVRGVIDEWEYRPPTSLIEQIRNALDGPQ